MTQARIDPPAPTDKEIQKFWLKIDRSLGLGPNGDCWHWIGGLTSQGYGNFMVGRRNVKSHRLAFFLVTGKWSTLFLCHKCDNPICCNPDHFFEGTHRNNEDDKVAKCRQLRGEQNAGARLTSDQVLAIREAYKHGDSQKCLGSRYGVSGTAIGFIVKRKLWKHI